MNEIANIMNIQGVRFYVDQNNVAQLNLDDVARGLGFIDTSKGEGTSYIRWARVDKHLENFGFATSGERPDFIPEPIFYLLAMKADNETARNYQHTIAYL